MNARHTEKVIETAQSKSAAAQSRLAASWRRSIVTHGLDPAEHRAPERLDEPALKEKCEKLERFLTIAAPKLDRLYTLVGSSGCGVLLTDADGVILDQRCSEADAQVFRKWGLWRGAMWSEAAEGTNGIGTCLAEKRRLIIHRDEHFFARNTDLSCMDAPIFGADGRVIAALDVSSARTDKTEDFNRLIAAMVAQMAGQIEADFFRASFPRSRVIVAESDETGDAILIAVDEDDIVVGANRAARRAYDLGSEPALQPRPAADLLEGHTDGSGFQKAERSTVKQALIRANGNVSAAARELGIGRATLYRRMKRLGLSENDG